MLSGNVTSELGQTYLHFKSNILRYGYLPSKNDRSYIKHNTDFPDIFF